MARLHQGWANTVRGAAHFLRETVGRVRYGRARGQLTVRPDSGFYTHAIVAVCRQLDVRFSITIHQLKSPRNLIEAILEEDWTPIPYWMDAAAGEPMAELSAMPELALVGVDLGAKVSVTFLNEATGSGRQR